jgi:hypothetical protein
MRPTATVDNFVAARASNFNKIQQTSLSRPQRIQQQSLRINKNPWIATSADTWFGTRRSKVSAYAL